MRKLGLEAAFKEFDAELDNKMWAVSAIAKDGALVLSCWQHLFGGGDKGVMRYTDTLSRWGNNKPGNNKLREHLISAYERQLPIRLVMAIAQNPKELDGIVDASKVKKTFTVREDVQGKVVTFDGDTFIVDFIKSP